MTLTPTSNGDRASAPPSRTSDELVGQEARDARGSAQGAYLRVAIIDDFAPMRTLVRTTLEGSDVARVVAEASGSPEDVAVACATEPDVVLLDQHLGGLRGTDMLGDILRARPTVMVAIFSALDPATEEERALRAGAFAFYEKDVVAGALPQVLLEDYALFQRALAGDEVCARSALDRRASLYSTK